MRPSEIAQDDTPDRPVFLHLIDWLRRNENYEFDGLVNLRCTTPFKKASDLAAILEILRDEDCSAVRSVTRIDGKNHPYWVLSRDSEGYAKQFVDGIDLHKYCRRQLLPPAYALNGVIDAMKCRVIEASPNFYGDKIMLYETDPLMSVDVDSPKDLALCESLTEVKA
ncbi:MAG: hypothetical protein A2X49_03545 [Lentisphaerae bacterium GWF2_52_8]|nr:MAG: hypothetical protein A2X49_03545 [Lentisphaerae bacterium GWF2_52_8]